MAAKAAWPSTHHQDQGTLQQSQYALLNCLLLNLTMARVNSLETEGKKKSVYLTVLTNQSKVQKAPILASKLTNMLKKVTNSM